MKFMNIAICDDDVVLCGALEELLIMILAEKDISHNIEVFVDGEQLCNELQKEDRHFDLVFLDIEMPNQTGVEVGRYIRDVLNNQQMEIAYISSKTSYAMSLFKVRPINFLEKPLTRDKIQDVIDTFWVIKEQTKQIYAFKYDKGFFSIRYSDILYFEHRGRKVLIHTFDKVYEQYASMEDIYYELKNHRFLFVHKSYIVNYNYVLQFERSQLVMTDHTVIPISQSRRADIQKKVAQYFEKELS